MKNWKEQLLREQFERKTPTLLLGSGASISTGYSLGLKPNFPGMPTLARRFHDKITDSGFSAEDQKAWAAFKNDFSALGTEWWKFNLEGFLTTHPLLPDSLLLRQIRDNTAEALNEPHEALAKLFESSPSISYPLRLMMERLLRSAPAAHPELTVVTPNYDLLVEYSADLMNVPCLTGFSGGILRRWKPELGFSPPRLQPSNGQKTPQTRRLRLIKPHGSAAWFQSRDDSSLMIEQFALRAPHGNWHRCMIAPGPSKYAEALMNVCRDHMHLMDEAFMNAQFLIVIGYGFNDRHLEEHLKRSLDRGTPAVYVTMEMSQQARDIFVKPYHNVTCITSDGVANGSGSRVQSGDKEWHLPNEPLWQLGRFVDEFIH